MDTLPLHRRLCPKSSRLSLDWMLANEMGPNAVWLAEILADRMIPAPGLRALDMGCGRAMTSIFLAQTYRLKVWAADLWISPDDNWTRIRAARADDDVFPLRVEAHNLPFAEGFFDTIVSIDSYQYYGTDDLYLGYLTRFLKEGGQVGFVMPAMLKEFDQPPPHLTRPQASGSTFWDPHDCWSLHTLQWWTRHFSRPGLVDIEVAEVIADGWKLWLEWEQIRNGGGFTGFPSDAETLEADRGEYIGFVLFVLKKRPRPATAHEHPLNIRL